MRQLPMKEWDQTVAPLLRVIEIRSEQIIRDARQIREWVTNLPAAPDFETRAEDALQRARNSLKEALDYVERAIEQYDAKDRAN